MSYYVGVSGIAHVAQQEMACEIARNAGLNDFDYKLLLGVKATETTQWLDEPNKYGTGWFPVGEDIRGAIRKEIDFDNRESLDGISFIDPAVQLFFGSLADDPELAKKFTEKILDRISGWVRYKHDPTQKALDTLQFDKYPWMEREQDAYFEWLANTRRINSIILQCHGDYLANFHPYEVTRRLNEILQLGVLSMTVLFDASHGTGKTMDPEKLRPFLGGVLDSRCGESVGLAVAGGLSGDNLGELVPPLIDEFGLLSWDAEGRLHYKDRVNNGGFDQGVLEKYLRASAEITRIYGYIEEDPDKPETD